MEIPYERKAMKGEKLPDGLSQIDQLLYMQLRSLYYQYRSGWITREMGSEEKKKFIAEYKKQVEKQDFDKKLSEWHSNLRKRIELAHSEYRKKPNIENAEKLSKTIDGFIRT